MTDIPGGAPVSVHTSEGSTTTQLLVHKEGKGRLYYGLTLRYAPTSLQPAPIDRGYGSCCVVLLILCCGLKCWMFFFCVFRFTVVRVLQPGCDPKSILGGERVKVCLEITVPATRYHVAVRESFCVVLRVSVHVSCAFVCGCIARRWQKIFLRVLKQSQAP